MSGRGASPVLVATALLAAGLLVPTMACAAAGTSVDAPVLRRAVLAVVCLLGGFSLCLRGWDRFAQRRRWHGVGLVAGGGLLGIAALSLLGLSEHPQTWNWWI